MKFLIQTVDNNIVHDFSFALIEAIKYQNWYNRNNDITYVTTDGDMLLENYTPVGSNDFVCNYIKKYYGENNIPKPINIPNDLMFDYYLSRNIKFSNIKDGTPTFNIDFPCFIKSDTQIKKYTNIIYHPDELKNVPDDKYIISDVIDIDSEYRCFIHKEKLVGLQNYSGDFTIFPNIGIIYEMINEYKTAPVAYTLDVGINKSDNKTFIIECHDMYSVGLYGMNDSRILPQMFNDWWKEYINKINN
jgi:hypothetical protein